MKSMHTKYENQKAFTLVELIIVITILAILATIAFISFKNYIGSARDSNKLTTLSNIETGLSLYQVKTGNYPQPDEIYGSGNYSGALLSQVGYVGTGFIQAVHMNKIPKDPIVDFEYTYGLSSNGGYYQLGAALEETDDKAPSQKYASKVVGNYKGEYIFSALGTSYKTNLPSLIFTQTGSQDFGDTSINPKFVINNGGNLVKPYDENNNEVVAITFEDYPLIVAWKDLPDTSCDNNDYVFTYNGTTYRWAGCNSVLGTGIEWESTDAECYNYAGGPDSCGTEEQMLSTAKEDAWNSRIGTVNNIWGKLYTYAQATSGACPTDWHLPTNDEWIALETHLNEGIPCRINGGWECAGLGWNGNIMQLADTNMVQELKIPLAGYRDFDSTRFQNRGDLAYLWSTSGMGMDAYIRQLYYAEDGVLSSTHNKNYAYSVRCLKNQ